MTSIDYLEKVTIGSIAELSGQIILHEYNPHWEVDFRHEKARIEKALRSKGIIVEHVGSTSVPGLCAKPVIDMLLLVKNSTDEDSYVRPLQDIGYTLRIREPEWFEHRMFKRKSPEVNLHVFSVGCEEARRMIVFRNWLRNNTTDRELYAAAKRKLAVRNWKYIQEYADAKSEIVREIFRHIRG